MDETLLEAAVTDRTRVVVPVHYAGVACEMDAIQSVADKHRLLIVEDAAQELTRNTKRRTSERSVISAHIVFTRQRTSYAARAGIAREQAGYAERAEIIREKGTNRSQFFRGQVDKYTWVDADRRIFPPRY